MYSVYNKNHQKLFAAYAYDEINNTIQSAIDKSDSNGIDFYYGNTKMHAYNFNNTGPSIAARTVELPKMTNNTSTTVSLDSSTIAYDHNRWTDGDSSLASHMNIIGSGDTGSVTIPPIDESKFDLKSALGWDFDTSGNGNTINQYYIDDNSSKYELIQAVLHNTFEVRSTSMEKILKEVLAELKAMRSQKNPKTSSGQQSPESMFDEGLPKQIERLAFG